MATASDRSRFDKALHSADPSSALHVLALALKSEGMGQLAMYHLFEDYQRMLDGDDPLHDVVVDTMDLIWGGAWAKGRGLFDHELTNAEVARPLQ